jgi:hypothetical protein
MSYDPITTEKPVICQFYENVHFAGVVISAIYENPKIDKHFR